jgi:tetratricopeptide (TPR) repeat protein
MTETATDVIKVEPAALRAACAEARAAVAKNPEDEQAAERLFELVSRAKAELPSLRSPESRTIAPQVLEAARLIEGGDAERAEALLRRHLTIARNDPDAMLLMADIAMGCGFPENAYKILRRSVEVHPRRSANWLALAKHLQSGANQSGEVALLHQSLASLETALEIEPDSYAVLSFKAAVLLQMRRLVEAEQVFERMLRIDPESASAWLDYAYVLKTGGRFGEAVAAFRTAIALDPENGAMWWSFADLKRGRFFSDDIERIEAALGTAMVDANRVNLHLALAAAYDQAKDYEHAAEQLREGNALRLKMLPYDRQEVEQVIDTSLVTYTDEFFAVRAGAGNSNDAPIFVLGMPRSGSTLVEQILSSHPSIEGTEELFAAQQIAAEIFRENKDVPIDETVARLPLGELTKLGARYLEITRFKRKTDRPRFTDKNPDNWRYLGLIRTILPNAKIIDIRRHPLDCCFANYTQHFLVGANYSYGFEELASRYADYLRLMRHFDAVAPGAVHRVIYEDLVENTEAEVRRLLAYLGLRFDERCLRFFETDRAILTPSSEQVRQPINRAGIGKWTKYKPWIGGLESGLTDILDNWRS